MLQRRTQLTSAALAAVLLFLVGCDTDQGPTDTTSDRTITQSPDAEQPDTTRPDVREDAREDRIQDGVEVDPQRPGEIQPPPDSPQPQDGGDQNGIEVEPEQ